MFGEPWLTGVGGWREIVVKDAGKADVVSPDYCVAPDYVGLIVIVGGVGLGAPDEMCVVASGP